MSIKEQTELVQAAKRAMEAQRAHEDKLLTEIIEAVAKHYDLKPGRFCGLVNGWPKTLVVQLAAKAGIGEKAVEQRLNIDRSTRSWHENKKVPELRKALALLDSLSGNHR